MFHSAMDITEGRALRPRPHAVWLNWDLIPMGIQPHQCWTLLTTLQSFGATWPCVLARENDWKINRKIYDGSCTSKRDMIWLSIIWQLICPLSSHSNCSISYPSILPAHSATANVFLYQRESMHTTQVGAHAIIAKAFCWQRDKFLNLLPPFAVVENCDGSDTFERTVEYIVIIVDLFTVLWFCLFRLCFNLFWLKHPSTQVGTRFECIGAVFCIDCPMTNDQAHAEINKTQDLWWMFHLFGRIRWPILWGKYIFGKHIKRQCAQHNGCSMCFTTFWNNVELYNEQQLKPQWKLIDMQVAVLI